MTAKQAILLLLLVFVATSTVYLIAGSDKHSAVQAPAQNAQAPAQNAQAPAQNAQAPAQNAQAPSTGSSKIIAYYFHVTVRCTTCRTIEAYSRETITNRFKNEIDRGRLEWQVVNVQLPENRHFVKDYELFTKSVVLVHIANGKQQSYKTLNEVWELVGDKAQFQAYVDREVRGYLTKL